MLLVNFLQITQFSSKTKIEIKRTVFSEEKNSSWRIQELIFMGHDSFYKGHSQVVWGLKHARLGRRTLLEKKKDKIRKIKLWEYDICFGWSHLIDRPWKLIFIFTNICLCSWDTLGNFSITAKCLNTIKSILMKTSTILYLLSCCKIINFSNSKNCPK